MSEKLKNIEESRETMRQIIDAEFKKEEPSKDVPEKELEKVKSPDSEIVENEQPENKEADVEEKETPEETKPEEDEKKDEDKNTSDKESGEEIELPQNMPKYMTDVLKSVKDKKVVESVIELHKNTIKSMQRKSRELSEHKKIAESLNDVFERHGKAKVKNKISTIEGLLKFESVAEKTPKVAIRKLMRALKIDPEEFLNDFVYNGDKLKQTDLQAEINGLKNELKSYKNKSANKEVQKEIEAFKNTKDSKGNLKYPHFDELETEMVNLLKVSPNLTLEQLYKKAFRLNDDLYNKSLEEEKAKVKEKLKLEKAKKISKQNISSRPFDSKPKSWNAKLRADLEPFLKDFN
jgi:hypothetical protein